MLKTLLKYQLTKRILDVALTINTLLKKKTIKLFLEPKTLLKKQNTTFRSGGLVATARAARSPPRVHGGGTATVVQHSSQFFLTIYFILFYKNISQFLIFTK